MLVEDLLAPKRVQVQHGLCPSNFSSVVDGPIVEVLVAFAECRFPGHDSIVDTFDLANRSGQVKEEKLIPFRCVSSNFDITDRLSVGSFVIEFGAKIGR